MQAPVTSGRKAFYVACLLLTALLFAAPAASWAKGEEKPAPPPARQVQTDKELPRGFYFDENAQQYKKRERITVQVENKNGTTQNKRVIRTTCYNLQHETDKSRVFKPVACNK